MSEEQKIALTVEKTIENHTEMVKELLQIQLESSIKTLTTEIKHLAEKVSETPRQVERMIDQKIEPLRSDIRDVHNRVDSVEQNMNIRIDSIQETKELKFRHVDTELAQQVANCQVFRGAQDKRIEDQDKKIDNLAHTLQAQDKQLEELGKMMATNSAVNKGFMKSVRDWVNIAIGIIAAILVNILSKKFGG